MVTIEWDLCIKIGDVLYHRYTYHKWIVKDIKGHMGQIGCEIKMSPVNEDHDVWFSYISFMNTFNPLEDDILENMNDKLIAYKKEIDQLKHQVLSCKDEILKLSNQKNLMLKDIFTLRDVLKESGVECDKSELLLNYEYEEEEEDEEEDEQDLNVNNDP